MRSVQVFEYIVQVLVPLPGAALDKTLLNWPDRRNGRSRGRPE